LQLEDKIGAMLPCNVIMQQHAGGAVEVSAVDPIASMQAIENPRLAEVAKECRRPSIASAIGWGRYCPQLTAPQNLRQIKP